MRLRFTIRDLLWLTLVVAGIAASVAAAIGELNAELAVKPHDPPPAVEIRFVCQFILGIAFVGVGAVFIFRRNRRTRK